MTIETGEKQHKTLADIEKEMRDKYPGLPEREIVGSKAWVDKIRAELAPHLIESIKGARKSIG